MAQRRDILAWCDENLQTAQFQDYAPNGLQVEGKEEIRKVVAAVSASFAAIEYAAAVGADMLLVHHGMFWKNEPVTITGWKQRRIATLLQHQINLVGYHLPLDAHPEWGNNAQLAHKMGWQWERCTGEQNLLNIGCLPEAQSLAVLGAHLSAELGRDPVMAGDMAKQIKTLAWCTGGAQSFFTQAASEGIDAYITGEISEPQYHLAHETGVAFISAGHHATERYGVQALAEAMKRQFGLEIYFFDEQNPA
jgi:dinuclear metal center YbgI/SA1388 family protein